MSEVRSIRILLSVRVGDGLIECGPHGDVVREVGGQATVEIGGACLKMGSESSVLHWQIVVFFLVHLLVDDILLGNA